MLYLSKKINAEDLIIIYLSSKIKNGYCPYFGRQELNNFLTYFSSRKPINNVNMNYEYLINRTIDKHTKRTLDGESHLRLDEYNMLRPTYDFSNYDVKATEINFLGKDEVKKIEKLIEEFLIPYPKRKIIISNELESKNIEISKMGTSLIIQLLWESYTLRNRNKGLWPKQCFDIEKYLLDYDLARLIDVPSIKKEIIEFYKSFSRRLSALIQKEEVLQISSNSKKLLAYSNYLSCIKDFEDLFKYIDGKYFDLNINEMEYASTYEINNNMLEDEKTKNIVKMLDRL